MKAEKRACCAILLALCLPVAACRYSPWETEPDCKDRLSKNLANLEESAAGSGDFRFAVFSDSHNEIGELDKIVSRINARGDISFVVVLGDITNTGLLMEYEWACRALGKLDMPRFYAIGNHDAISFGKDVFNKMFGPYDYAIGYRESKLIVFNSNKFEFPDVPDYPLIAKLAEVSPGEVRRHTVGLAHVAPVVDVYDEEDVRFEEAFYFEHGFNLAVHGHRNFHLWRDGYGTAHVMADLASKGEYDVLTLHADSRVTLEVCRPDCAVHSAW